MDNKDNQQDTSRSQNSVTFSQDEREELLIPNTIPNTNSQDTIGTMETITETGNPVVENEETSFGMIVLQSTIVYYLGMVILLL